MDASTPERLDDYALGVLIGVLIVEGHFGGDGVRAQITLRMHVRHERLFRWLEQRDDSPWYPTARLFRQPERDDWRSMISGVREEFARFFLA